MSIHAQVPSSETPLQKLRRLQAKNKLEQERSEVQNLATYKGTPEITTSLPKVPVPEEITTKQKVAAQLAALRTNSTATNKATADKVAELKKLAADRALARKTQSRLRPSTITGIASSDNTLSTPAKVQIVLPTSAIPEEKKVELETIGQLNKNEVSIQNLNPDQLTAVRLAESGESFNLIGSAGSGKTTTTRVVATSLASNGTIGTLPEATKVLVKGAPSIVIVSFTNQAVRNIKAALPEEFKANCMTIHKLLEYAPEYYDYQKEDGTMGKKMVFEPHRGLFNPINGVTHCVIEEAGSVSVSLYDQLRGALGRNCTYIYLGDLNQLPPVFGDAILGFKLLEHPIVELKKIYRQDNDSAIKKLAYRILEGRPIGDEELLSFNTPDELDIIKFKQTVSQERATIQMGKHFQELVRKGEFRIGEDQILIPYGKAGTFGAVELNRYIAQEDAILREVPTYEVIVGFTKEYYAVGDYVMYAKMKYQITDIQPNTSYVGVPPQAPSVHLDRWGNNPDILEAGSTEIMSQDEMDSFFTTMADMSTGENENKMQQSSHTIKLTCLDMDKETTITAVGDIADMALCYAMTVHKSQGSEWERVFCIFHETHAVMAKREILYTSITRARKYLRIYYSGEKVRTPNESFFQKGVIKQYIKGTTLEHKLNFFRNKVKAQAIKKASALRRGTSVAGMMETMDTTNKEGLN